MKMTKIRFAGFLLFVLSASCLFLTCDVGLGNSVDTKPPTVSITSPSADSDIAGTFTATGAASDETSLKSVSVSFVETTDSTAYGPFAATINATANTWSVSLNNKKADGTYEIKDGTYKITVTATDGSNRTSVATTVYQLDNTAPTVLVTAPLTYGTDNRISYYNAIDIKGEVYDASSIDSVVVSVIAPGATDPCDSKTADGTNTWAARFDYSSTVPSGIADGSVCSYKVVAKDHAGNTNTYFFHRADIYPLLTAASDGSVTFPSMYQIGRLDQLGSATDLGGLTKEKLAAIKHGQPQTASQLYPDFTFRNGSSPTVDWNNITTAKNIIGVGVPLVGDIRPPADGSSILPATIKFYIYKSGQSRGAACTDVKNEVVSSSVNFTVQTKDSGGTALAEGSYKIDLEFTTNTNKVYKSWLTYTNGVVMTMAFNISSGAPTLTETTIASDHSSPFSATKTTNDSSAIALSGKATNSAGLATDTDGNPLSVKYTITKSGSPTVTGKVFVDSGAVYTIPALSSLVPASGGIAGDGTYIYSLSVEISSVPATLSRTIIVDHEPPRIAATSVSSSTSAKKVNGKITISGTITDNVAVSSATYSINGVAQGSILNGLPSWTTTEINTALYADGTKLSDLLGFTVTDTAGNAGVVSSTSPAIDLSSYVIDQASDKPVISFTNLTSGATYLSNNLGSTLVLNGTISDDDGVDRTKILIAVGADANQDGVPDTPFTASSYVPVNGLPATNGTLVSFFENISTLVEGFYVLQVQAGDINAGTSYGSPLYNWTESSVEKFVVDKSPPVVTIDQVQNSYQSSSFMLSGTATDGSAAGFGIKNNKVIVNGSDVAVDADHKWSTTIVPAEGKNTVSIVAYDFAGQVANASFTYTKDTVAPTVTVDATTATYLSLWRQTTNVLISGTYVDASSKVKSVEYSTDNTNWTALTMIALTTPLPTEDGTWSGIVTFPESATNKLYIRATDNAGNVTTLLPYTVKVDATKPTLTETLVAAAASPKSYNGNITFKGDVSDSVSLLQSLTLSYTRNGGTSTSIPVNVSDFTGSGYTFLVNATSHENDGSYEFTLTATDNAGNASTVSYTVTVETVPPVVTFNMTPSNSTSGKYNGSVPVKASITDDNTIKSLYWQVSNSATAPTLSPTDEANAKTNAAVTGWTQAPSPLNSLSTSWDSSSVGMSADETRYVWVLACDRFGNIASASNAMTVNQLSDKPVITFTNLTTGAAYLSNNLGSTLILNGTISDDDGVDKSKIFIGVAADANHDGNPDAPFTYVPVTGLPATNGTQVSFSENIGTTGLNLAEGFYVLQVRVGDINSGVYDSASYNWSESSVEKFVVDKAPPVVTIDQAQNGYHNGSFTLSGTAIDGGGIDGFGVQSSLAASDNSIKYCVDSSTTYQTVAVNTSTHVWSIPTFDASALSDGPHTISIVAYDLAGQISNASFKFTKDTTPPSVAVDATTDMSLNSWYRTTNVLISGTDSDVAGSGVKSVEYSIDSTDGTNGTWTALTMTGTTWSGIVTFPESATNKLYIRATDNAGNVTTLLPRTVKVDATKPTLAETLVAASASPKSYNGNITFKGDVSDSVSLLQSLTLSYTRNGGTSTSIPVNVSDFTGSGYTFLVNATSHENDGSYEFTLTATDNAGNASTVSYTVTVETVPPVVTFNMTPSNSTSGKYNGSVPVKASITDDNTIKSLYWQVSNSATAPTLSPTDEANAKTNAAVTGWTQAPSPLNSLSASWDSSSVGMSADETRYVWVLACDRFGNIASASNAMTVNQLSDKPVITFTNLTTGAAYLSNNLGSTLNLNGTISDDDGVDKSKIFIRYAPIPGADGTANTVPSTPSWISYVPVTGVPSTNGTQVSFSENIGSTGLNLAEGFYVLQVRVGDINSGVYDSASYNWSESSAEKFVVDKAPPVVTIDQAQNGYHNGSFTLSGTAIDGGGIDGFGVQSSLAASDNSIKYCVDSSTTYQTVAVNSTTHEWTTTFDASALSDGPHTISIVAYDLAGQVSNASFKFTEDKTAPNLIVSTINGGTSSTFYDWKKTSSLTVVGTSDDGTGSGTASVEYSLDGITWSQLSGASSWNGSIPVTDVTSSVRFRSTDNAGNSTTLAPIPVRIDLVNPVLTVSTPSSVIRVNGSSALAAAFIAQDTAGSGVASVKLKIGTAVFTAPDATASFISGDTWTASIPAATLAALTNGQQYSVYVQAADTAGNTTTTSFPIIIDTQKPTVSFTTPVSGTTVNKTINITGTGSDDQALSSVVVSIEKSDLTTWETVKTFSGTAGFNWSVTGFDTTAYSVATYDTDAATSGIQLTLRAVATDEAGNISVLTPATTTRTFTVDQNSDRPIIKLSNLATIDGTTTLKMTKTVYGTVSDDDGTIASIAISDDGTTYTTLDSTQWDGSTFSYVASGTDGKKELWFKIVDAAGTTFTTTQSGMDDLLTEPRIWRSAAPTYADSTVVYKVDTVPPEINSTVRVDRQSVATSYNFEADSYTTNLTTNLAFGGTTAKFSVEVAASDANGIASVLVAVPGVDADSGTAGEQAFVATETAAGSGLFRTAEINSSTLNGSETITITVTDNSGLSSTTTRTVLMDNIGPNVSVTSHTANEQVTGDVILRGTADDGTGSGVVSVSYKVGGDTAWTLMGTTLSWEVDFTSAANKVITTTATYANATNATETSSGSNVWILPIQLRAIDTAGNTSDQMFYLNVDPNGDNPTVAVSYPASGTTLGGNIRIFGSAADNVSVSSVWMEIDTDNNGVYDSTDIAALAAVIGAPYGASAALTNGFTVDGTASWSKTINSVGEFNAAGAGTNTIRFRVRACDNHSLYGTWSNWRSITIDNKAPKVGSSIPLKLVQYTDGTLTTIASEQSYVSDMYIRGLWYLVGSVEDESAIKTISVSGSSAGTLVSQPSWFVQGTKIGSYYDYTLKIPVGKDLSDTSCGALSYSIYVEDGSDPTGTTTQPISINYDNKPPTVVSPTHGGLVISASNPVVQSNNTFTFSSTVTESGSSDSGFNRLVFFFVRRSASGPTLDRVYNPMISVGSYSSMDVKDNRTDLGNLTWDTGDVPRLAITGATRAGEDSLTHSSIVGNYNVRVGGLVRIAGVDRLIKSVDRTAGTITFSPSASTTYTAASLLYGLVVDNTVVETLSTDGVTITNDDGDGMVESVVKSGGNWSWDASVNSKNIPDGPIDLYYVAYDKAGNSVSGSVSSSVTNSGPRIAKVQIGTDLDGNGLYSTSEVSTVYSYSGTSGSEPSKLNIADPSFTMKDKFVVLADIVGGNGTMKYVWAAGDTSLTAPTTSASPSPFSSVSVTGGSTYPYSMELTPDAVSAYEDAKKILSFSVWDSTDETTPGTDSQWALLNVPITIDVIDGISPTAAIQPFYWTSASDNSLYGNSKTNGHIEYTSIPSVSGQVSIRGTAFDDKRLTALWMNIDDNVSPLPTARFSFSDALANKTFSTGTTPATRTYYRVATYGIPGSIAAATDLLGFTDSVLIGNADIAVGMSVTVNGSPRTIATWNSATGKITWTGSTVSKNSATPDYTYIINTSKWYGTDVWSTYGWKFTVTPVSLTQSGHTVTWQLDWDSSKVSDVANAGNYVRVIAEDRKGSPAATAGTQPNASTESSINTTTSTKTACYQMNVVPYITGVTRSSNATRSRLGKYPLRDSETNIAITGFNITMPTTQDTNNWVRIYSAASGGNFDADLLTVQSSPAPTSSAFDITMNANSNSGYLRMAVNGVEAINNIDDNSQECNKEISSGSASATAAWNDDRYLEVFRTGDYFSGSADPEYISMSVSSTSLVGEWSNSAAAASYYATPVADGNTRTRFFTTYDPPSYTDVFVDPSDNVHSVILENYYGGSGTTDWGYLASYRNNGTRVPIESLGDDTSGAANSSDGMDEKLNQFQNARIAVRGTTNDQYVSYYDYYSKCLKYGRMNSGAQTWVAVNGHQTDSLTVVDGTDDFSATLSDSSDVGVWSDIQIDTVGGTDTTTWRPVIVYYDNANEKLKLARGNSSQPSGTAGWTIQDVTGGAYLGNKSLSMKIDTNGDLHIITCNSMEGGLYYIHATNINGTGSYVFDTPVLVDSTVTDGSWADLTLNGTTPMVSYRNGTSYKGLKYAYVSSGTGLSASDWEYMVVPTATTVNDGRTCIEYTSSATVFPYDGNVAFGYPSATFQIVYLRRQVP